MARPVKSQWDFGELFPQEQYRKVLSVAELTTRIRRLLESQVGRVWVSGEITNLRVQSSGHIYFSLKDASAQLGCVLFRGESQVNRALLQDGRKVILEGELTVYEPRGQYQLRVTSVEVQGVGALQVAFEKLKQKLHAEGLFAAEHKRALPPYPLRLGLVTSPSGAALRDVIHVVERRHPGLQIVLAPCRVQGEGAAAEIAAAIRILNDYHRMQSTGIVSGESGLDLVLVTRGGGSLEDLWAFNEEVVARAIYESELPVISAVGHEIDFTISDFVADVRAATPSAAAEILTEGVFASTRFLRDVDDRLRSLVEQQIEAKRDRLLVAAQRLARVHPRRRLSDWMQRLDELQTSLARCARQGVRQQRAQWQHLVERIGRVRPALLLARRRERLQDAERGLSEQAQLRLREHRSRVEALAARLRLLGPEQVLARGYSITTDAETGRVLRCASEAPPGQRIQTRLSQGRLLSRVEES